jgi:signal transduction histidine kinase
MRTTRRSRSTRRRDADLSVGTPLSSAARDAFQARLGLFLLANNAPRFRQAPAGPRWTELASDPLLRQLLGSLAPNAAARPEADAPADGGRVAHALAAMEPADAATRELETAVERARLSEQLARVRVEALERRAALLSSVTELLEATPETLAEGAAVMLTRLASLLVPSLADLVRIDLLREDGTLEAAAIVHAPGIRNGWIADGAPEVAERVARSGSRAVVGSAADADETDWSPEFRAAASLPMQARGRRLGVLTLATVGGARGLDAEDVRLAEDVARSAAVALDNARLFVEARAEARCREQALAAVSHEMRSPLQVISIASGALLRAWPADTALLPERRQIAVIAQSAERMRRLAGDLLDLARMDAGSFSVTPEPVRVGVLLHSALEVYRPLAEQKDVRLCVAPFPTLSAFVDEQRVHQVFANLIGNAVRYTPAGGTITLSAEAEEGAVRFSVTDTGAGIAPENLPRVFERFWQGDSARGCAGLGLAISRAIVEAHDGTIRVDSEPGQGTTFSFTLPLAGA